MKLVLIVIVCIAKLTFSQTATEYYDQSKLNFDEKSFIKALKSIESAIKIDSSDANFFLKKAQIQIALKNYKESYETYNQAITIFPKESSIYSERGNLLLSFQEFNLAIKDFTVAMNNAKSDSLKNQYIKTRAAAKISKRDFNGAYQDLLTAFKFDSTNITTLTDLGVVCDEIGKESETIKYLLKTIKLYPSFYPTYEKIGFKYHELGQYKKAIECFNKMLQFNPMDAQSYSNRSYNKFKLGLVQGAMIDINKSIQLNPASSYAYRIRALIYLKNENIKNACLDLKTAREKGFTASYGQEVINLQKKHCEK